MRIIDRSTVSENMSATRSIQNFGSLLNDKPEKLGQVVTMRPDLSISMLTQALKNIYTQGKGSKESFTPINAMAIEWQIDVNYIKRVKCVSVSGPIKVQTPGTVVLGERYFDRNDTFAAENRQQYFVTKDPVPAAGGFEYTVVLVGNDLNATGDDAYLGAGRTVKYRSNYHPELSELGYTKFLSNTETHRNYISRHRASVPFSSDYAIREEVFIADGKEGKEKIYKLNKKEKDTLDTFLLSREQSLLWSESNFDINGKCLLQDEKGRDIPMGDGVIPQIEKVCDKTLFSTLSLEMIEDGMSAMAEKCENETGNHWSFVCNRIFWNKFQRLIAQNTQWKSPGDGSYFWSKSGKYIKVGASYNCYEFSGNTITFMVNRALSEEYHDKAYAIMLDIGKDGVSGRPNIAMFTLEGNEMVSGNLEGLGKKDGKTSGDIASSVHGSSYHLIGYAGAVVFNPYKAHLFEEAV